MISLFKKKIFKTKVLSTPSNMRKFCKINLKNHENLCQFSITSQIVRISLLIMFPGANQSDMITNAVIPPWGIRLAHFLHTAEGNI